VRASGIEAETIHSPGPPDDVVLGVASGRKADLIVVGNVGMRKASRIRMGPIPERIAREAPCDVLIVFTRDEPVAGTGDARRPYQGILVGVDGSPTAAEAARTSFDLAMMFRTEATLLYVAGDPMVGSIVLEQVMKQKPNATAAVTKIVEGDPAEKICGVARDEGIQLIVVGNRGLTGARRMVMGSVPSKVAHGSPCDVLIVKTSNMTLDDLAPGSGGLVDVDGRKVAAYRNEDGSIVALSPRCQHMGCTVGWNGAEKTWDCPCHGSRYAKDGAVIQGPAAKALDPVDLDAAE
ncbi:MAG TPA: universal stress protein, partial [Actinomycetota bacterium]|nr:universal stress protein [Actinomycetota bacterium]